MDGQPRLAPEPIRHDGVATWRPLVLIGALALVAGAVAGVLAIRSNRASAGEPVTTVRWHDRGDHPFWEAMPTPNLGALHDQAGAVARDTEPGEGPGGVAAVVVRGTTPGLYGGSQRQVCDVGQLKQLVADDDGARRRAFARVTGVAPDDVGPWLDGLTPVILTADTWVTRHGFADGEPLPLASVLQARTAVLVDRTGVPRVACSSGDPLTPPDEGVSPASTQGSVWDGYEPDRVVTVEPGAPVDTLDLVDVSSGARVSRPVGAGAGWVAVANEPGSSSAPGRGHLLASADGLIWDDVFQAEEPLLSVAHGDGRWLAAGTDNIYASTDRRTWQTVAAVPGPIADLAFGDGRWLAVGTTPGDGGRKTGVVYESRDGATWRTSAEITDGRGVSLSSVAFGNGRWVVAEAAADEGRDVRVYTNGANRGWHPVTVPDTHSRRVDVAFGDGRWVLLGAGITAISNDGVFWTTSPLEPREAQLLAPIFSGSRWYAASVTPLAAASTALVTSEDAVHWTSAGQIPLGGPAGLLLAEVSYGGGPTPAASTIPLAPTTSEPGASTGTGPAGASERTARITGADVSRRSAPSRSAAASGKVARGAEVRIECQAIGESVTANGVTTPVWDRLAGGGYVSDAYTDVPKSSPPAVDPAIGACPP